MGEQLFMMDAGYTMASWGKWQKRLFEVARAYDHQLFTEDALYHLAARMEKEARLAPKVAQDSVKVHVSDWHENRKYGCGPYIQIGTYPKAVLVRFIFINGQYVFGSHEFEVANTRKGYVVEAYMPDKDGGIENPHFQIGRAHV